MIQDIFFPEGVLLQAQIFQKTAKIISRSSNGDVDNNAVSGGTISHFNCE
jgi:hypothetical protein